MIAPGVSVAAAVGVACILCGAAGLLGYVLDTTDAPARLWRAVRRSWRETTETEWGDWLDCGDDDGGFDRDIEPVMDIVAEDPLPAFCCGLFPDCVHDARIRAELGDPDALAHAATPESFRDWLAQHGLEDA